jgi:hypothetical protein
MFSLSMMEGRGRAARTSWAGAAFTSKAPKEAARTSKAGRDSPGFSLIFSVFFKLASSQKIAKEP